ncbi:hypothetical protein LTR85_011574 [Meristemomyces frigidus]|nr:hypothetical protein LTR85_011574 [Meristemomyces frigidus]
MARSRNARKARMASEKRTKKARRELRDLGHSRSNVPQETTLVTAPRDTTFLDLPAELRNAIYELVLLGPSAIAITRKSRPKLPSLLRTNRQIREETCAIYFAGNTFHGLVYHDKRNGRRTIRQPAICLWLDTIGRANCALIRRSELSSTEGFTMQLELLLLGVETHGLLARDFARGLFDSGVRDEVVAFQTSVIYGGAAFDYWAGDVREELQILGSSSEDDTI